MIASTLVLGSLGLLLGVGLAFAAKYLEVKEDERITVVEKLLPNYNCGACGTPGCHAFAVEIVAGRAGNVSKCKPGKAEKNFNPILAYLKDHPNEDGSAVNIKL